MSKESLKPIPRHVHRSSFRVRWRAAWLMLLLTFPCVYLAHTGWTEEPVAKESPMVGQPGTKEGRSNKPADTDKQGAAYKTASDVKKELERMGGRASKPLPTASINERIWYEAPLSYKKLADSRRQLAQLLADHLVTAEILLAQKNQHQRRLGLGLANAVVDGLARHLEKPKAATEVVEALTLPNIDAANNHAHELSHQTIIATALYAYTEANQLEQCDDLYRLLHKYSYNKNSANAAKYLLAQSLAKQGKLSGAITTLQEVRGSGVSPKERNKLLSQYRRDLIGGNFQLDVLSSAINEGSCDGTQALPLMNLPHANTRAHVEYYADYQARTQPIFFQIGLTEGCCYMEGPWTPDNDNRELWIFSDDGCAIWIDGQLVLDRWKKGQHLGSWKEHGWSPSLFKIPDNGYSEGQTYQIKICYVDRYYQNYDYFADIDGCTLFVTTRIPNLTVSMSPSLPHVDQSITITAKATESNGSPGVGKLVTFTVDGTGVGSATTLGDGKATITYVPSTATKKQFSATSPGYTPATDQPLIIWP